MSEKIKKNIRDAEISFFMEADPQYIREILQETMPDMNKYTKKKDLTMAKIKFLAKATANKQRDNELLKIANGFKDAIEKNIDRPLQFLKTLMSQKLAATFNSSLDKLSQEEIIELIKDQNLVNLLDQLDQQHGTDNKG